MSSYPKRKRAQVSYTELDSDNGEHGPSENHVALISPSKKRPKKLVQPLPKHKIFPFMDLPRELRDEIYCELLTDSKGIYLANEMRGIRRVVKQDNREIVHEPWWKKDRRYDNRPCYTTYTIKSMERQELATHFLAVSHVIKSEAEPWLYSDNRFILEDTVALHGFVTTLTPSTRGLLRRITILGWGWTQMRKPMNFSAFSTLAEGGVNLRSLRFDCDLRCVSTSDLGRKLAKLLYRSCFLWLEAMARIRGVEDALAVLDLTVENLKETPKQLWNQQLQKGESQPPPSPEEVLQVFRRQLKQYLGVKEANGSGKGHGKV
ncbi:hypothetical protein EV356DRAFT_530476 [Viridothelium virens]|uniref:F-box domain-containing protein n=1 Tax=Viridothelium virens TaxID=1048519 RepID=A0A6A6HFR9_VIRVR|nr:hypothetical protein EV356DRAFT_530476 [Viridothelium virens]